MTRGRASDRVQAMLRPPGAPPHLATGRSPGLRVQAERGDAEQIRLAPPWQPEPAICDSTSYPRPGPSLCPGPCPTRSSAAVKPRRDVKRRVAASRSSAFMPGSRRSCPPAPGCRGLGAASINQALALSG